MSEDMLKHPEQQPAQGQQASRPQQPQPPVVRFKGPVVPKVSVESGEGDDFEIDIRITIRPGKKGGRLPALGGEEPALNPSDMPSCNASCMVACPQGPTHGQSCPLCPTFEGSCDPYCPDPMHWTIRDPGEMTLPGTAEVTRVHYTCDATCVTACNQLPTCLPACH